MESNLQLDDSERVKKRDAILSLRNVKITRFFLTTISAWPSDELSSNMSKIMLFFLRYYTYYMPLQEYWLLCGCIYFICFADLDLLSFGHDLLSTLLTFIACVRLTIVCFTEYRRITEDFFLNFHLVHYKHKGSHYEEVFKRIEKVSFYLSIYTSITLMAGCVMFNASPVYNNFKSGAFTRDADRTNISLDFSVFFDFPSFNRDNHFTVITFVNCYFSYNCAVIVCGLDALLTLMVVHAIGHIMILRMNLERIEQPEEYKRMEANSDASSEIKRGAMKYNKTENKKFAVLIEEFVIHHKSITSFLDRLSQFFGPILALNYCFHLVSLCMLLLLCSQGDLNTFVRFFPLTIIVFGQLIELSVIFEITGTVSEKLPDALYTIPWECLDVSNQRSVSILLQRLQSPIHVTAMGMTTVGVTTMAGILKTTFSYFAFLRSRA